MLLSFVVCSCTCVACSTNTRVVDVYQTPPTPFSLTLGVKSHAYVVSDTASYEYWIKQAGTGLSLMFSGGTCHTRASSSCIRSVKTRRVRICDRGNDTQISITTWMAERTSPSISPHADEGCKHECRRTAPCFFFVFPHIMELVGRVRPAAQTIEAPGLTAPNNNFGPPPLAQSSLF